MFIFKKNPRKQMTKCHWTVKRIARRWRRMHVPVIVDLSNVHRINVQKANKQKQHASENGKWFFSFIHWFRI